MTGLHERLNQAAVDFEDFGFQAEVVRDAKIDIKAAEGQIAAAVEQMVELLTASRGETWPLKGGDILKFRYKDANGQIVQTISGNDLKDPNQSFHHLMPGRYKIIGLDQAVLSEGQPPQPALWIQAYPNVETVDHLVAVETLSNATDEEIAAARAAYQTSGA